MVGQISTNHVLDHGRLVKTETTPDHVRVTKLVYTHCINGNDIVLRTNLDVIGGKTSFASSVSSSALAANSVLDVMTGVA